jgi:hypothetical protein
MPSFRKAVVLAALYVGFGLIAFSFWLLELSQFNYAGIIFGYGAILVYPVMNWIYARGPSESTDLNLRSG